MTQNIKPGYEPYRPAYHLTPKSGWLNDPNGMVYYKGVWHLFYQYDGSTKFPGIGKWWAHSTSRDLVNWEEQPVALSPDEYGSMWSGSAVVDFNNSTGLFGDTPDKTGLVAYYTVTTDPECVQRQAMAYSKDEGLTWTKYNGGKPVIDTGDDPLHDGGFRDPKVFWHEESGQWMMIVAGGPARFYSSDNLIDWRPEGNRNDIHTECPDFYSLPVDGDEKNRKWVLSCGGVWYITGDFKKLDGVWNFYPDTGDRLRFNCGPDVYASQSFSDAPDGRRIIVSWMTDICYSWDTGNVTDPWSGAMTLPYELSLKTVGGQLRLVQTPVKELAALKTDRILSISDVALDADKNPLEGVRANCCAIDMQLDVGDAENIIFTFFSGENQKTELKYNRESGVLKLDRRQSGACPVERFPAAYSAVVPAEDGKLKLEIFIDRCSAEIFAQDGKRIFTFLLFPDAESDRMELTAKGAKATAEKLDIYRIDKNFFGE